MHHGTYQHPAGGNQRKKVLDEGPTASVISRAEIACFLIGDCVRELGKEGTETIWH